LHIVNDEMEEFDAFARSIFHKLHPIFSALTRTPRREMIRAVEPRGDGAAAEILISRRSITEGVLP